MAKIQLTPDWLIGPKSAGKALVMWLAIIAVVLGAVYVVSTGGLGAVGEVGNETISVTNSTDSVYVDVTGNENVTDGMNATISVTNESGSFVADREITLADNATTSTTIDADDIEKGNYTVIVEAEQTAVESVEIGTIEKESGGVPGAVEDNAAEIAVALVGVVALLVGVVLARDAS
ncbi:hypothetical protein [Halovivax cerinus]|uniref:PGF-CTERM sorting domain-containing protein n=1 Tax=Halovivax cerinus TaxID=1487865 RepID=A0ABD5NLW4_9EURY|nr:hypothetical protein [Halovivax cerinus]